MIFKWHCLAQILGNEPSSQTILLINGLNGIRLSNQVEGSTFHVWGSEIYVHYCIHACLCWVKKYMFTGRIIFQLLVSD